MFRIGNGIDFHKLVHEPMRPMILGGLHIDSEYALMGHSDADIVLHSLADAILGALALGDIGDHFPDTDPKWKNMNSKLIVEKTLDLMREKKFHISNIDITIVAERPKISPVRREMIESIAGILGLEAGLVSVKATTMEGMGSLGRAEGMMVLSSVLLEKSK
ncbi:2-C-methyl-D-erythritol 2,4-cyclodiphosphate synthase [Leptospira sp. GIMC2001]|uniref:2-C-methyl-D-erythritol 2,4-cyclodiphosphate synthase n=1 Tax=Leptospira sp. GIMC2001 TaxID=1513297 RepID=UPI00234AB24A|nr:2-C-methyl-D-erythritol 2,4-cyclodiphosphate synthase [Leptospira sp. GIMC2001]WCL48552.1 2-C-methyl-D-erythritol 2,4-cyclodiphosphate synthase [Leptospira sp. GIMC2001]